jgi:hypothetical protein
MINCPECGFDGFVEVRQIIETESAGVTLSIDKLPVPERGTRKYRRWQCASCGVILSLNDQGGYTLDHSVHHRR